MKKTVLLIASAALVGAGILILTTKHPTTPAATYTVGILQTASHPALDATREGFMEELSTLLNGDITWVVHNAQGTISQAHAIAQQLHTNSAYNAFFAIATPAAQALASVEKERPIIIAAVTDPASLGFVSPTTNVCGISDMIDIPAQIDMLIKLLPKAQTIGLLYTSGEANSVALVQKMEQELTRHGLMVSHFAVSGEADIQAMTESACRKVDVLLTPTDNTIAATMPLITSITRTYLKPLIASHNAAVAEGALAARGVDYKESGKEAARVAYALLVDGAQPADLSFTQGNSNTVMVNQDTLALLSLEIPEDMQNYVLLVNDAA